MTNLLVAFSKPEDGRSIKNILVKNGIHVVASCTSGGQVLAQASELASGIVVCGYRFGDMNCLQMSEQLPPEFSVLLVASPSKWSGEKMGKLICLAMPFKPCDLVSTVRMMEELRAEQRRRKKQSPPQRSGTGRRLIEQAKEVLIFRNHMTEPEAHRYLQRCSMDSQIGMEEAAAMILSLYKID